MKKSIITTLILEGLHKWIDIPNTEELKDVQYLKDLHRHLFHFKCVKTINHYNRDVEFINLKHQIIDYLNQVYYSVQHRCLLFDYRSCEMIAEELINQFNLTKCEVFEDGENGCILEVEND